MAASARIDELRHRYAARPHRYFAPLANALRQQGAFDEAVEILRDQLAHSPQHLIGHVVLGQTLFDMGALVESRAAFEAAQTLDPGNRIVLRHLGEIASLAGDVPTARLWFGRLRAAEPYADDIASQLGDGASTPPGVDDGRVEAAAVADASREVVASSPYMRVAADDADVQTSPHDQRHAPSDADAGHPAPEADATFELLDFAPVTLDPVALEPAARDEDAAPPAALDPVVGLDVPPAAPPAVLAEGEGTGPAHALGTDTPETPEPIGTGAFATETMAGLLAAQGHTREALAVYDRLLAERPDDAALRARAGALRGASNPIPAPALETPMPAAAADGGLPAAPNGEPDDAARAAMLGAAFADLGRASPDVGTAPQPAPHARPAPADDPFEDLTFDRFFADAEPAAVADAAPSAAPSVHTTDDVDHEGDLERFDAWLRGAAA